MILGPDGRPACGGNRLVLPSDVFRRLAAHLKTVAWDNRHLEARLLGPDGRPLYSDADTRAGRTISVKLPDRFRTTTKERP